jgi:large subunit ribosomal protein L5
MAKEKKQQSQQKVQTKKQKGPEKGKDKDKKTEQKVEEKVPSRLYERYKSDIINKMKEFFSYKSVMQVPRLEKISVNMGIGLATQDPKILEDAAKELELIVGQKPLITKAKKSVSNFKLREGMAIGCKVTLRKAMMYEFLDRLISIAIPRIRDFRGISDKSFDGRGNFTMGIKEHIIFPEINVDKITRLYGMDITVVTSAKTDQEAYELLKHFGMPFHRKEAAVE